MHKRKVAFVGVDPYGLGARGQEKRPVMLLTTIGQLDLSISRVERCHPRAETQVLSSDLDRIAAI
jgi:hypothetical protein